MEQTQWRTDNRQNRQTTNKTQVYIQSVGKKDKERMWKVTRHTWGRTLWYPQTVTFCVLCHVTQGDDKQSTGPPLLSVLMWHPFQTTWFVNTFICATGADSCFLRPLQRWHHSCGFRGQPSFIPVEVAEGVRLKESARHARVGRRLVHRQHEGGETCCCGDQTPHSGMSVSQARHFLFFYFFLL